MFTLECFAKNLQYRSGRFERLCKPYAYSGDNSALEVEVSPQISISSGTFPFKP
jgi:hypothetical protein